MKPSNNETKVAIATIATQELLDYADFVNVVENLKMPKDFKALKGIQY